MSTITIAILHDAVNLKEFFGDLIKDHVGDLYGELVPALDLDLQDERANIDGVENIGAEVKGNVVQVSCFVDYSAHFGCRDMSYSERDRRTLTGEVDGDQFVFEKHVRAERSTHDEF
ncbi:hypothetical protein [Polaromonas sp.]|uniref:hypothetical protein n=1 Tax=Polaromonas sp. TaxID=1869339 RepID=UPI00352A4566